MSSSNDHHRAATTTAPTTMQAIVQERYGLDAAAVLHLAERPVPTPGAGEVLVEVAAAGVDRGTWHLMVGLPLVARLALGLRGPRRPVPGLDLAGTVAAVGPGAGGFAVGDEVLGIGKGSFAEYTVAPVAKLVHRPPSLPVEAAAAVPVSGLTGLQAVRKAALASGDRLLVLGASGGVGSYAVQVAAAEGIRVTGVAGPTKLDFVHSLGADEVVDYTTEDPCADAGRFDAIIDLGGNRPLRTLRRALTAKGRLIVAGGEDGGRWLGGIDRQLRAGLLSPFVPQTLGGFLSSENAADIGALVELIEAGRVVPAVDRMYPLADAAQAITDLAAGRVRGKVVLTV